MDAPVSDRARRLGQVKFMALEIPPEADPQEADSPAADRSDRGWPRRLLDFLASRVSGRLVAARP